MNILDILRFTFSPKTYKEEDSISFTKTQELVSEEANRDKFLYKISEPENLTYFQTENSEIEALADKHWKDFKKELILSEDHRASNYYPVLSKIAAIFLFLINPVMIYKIFEKALTESSVSQNLKEPFLFSLESIHQMKDISMEVSILLITLPVILFLIAFILKRKTNIFPLYFILFNLSVTFVYGYYELTHSDSVVPFFTAFLVSLLGIVFFLIKKGK